MKIPTHMPEKGFYYHYKHDPSGTINNYAYEVLNVGCHTEGDCRPLDTYMVIYRPLYQSASVYKAGKLCDLRPLEMFMENISLYGVPRFRKITDAKIIGELEVIKNQMYS